MSINSLGPVSLASLSVQRPGSSFFSSQKLPLFQLSSTFRGLLGVRFAPADSKKERPSLDIFLEAADFNDFNDFNDLIPTQHNKQRVFAVYLRSNPNAPS